MQTLKDLKPSLIWEMFEKICAIPRPSKHEEAFIRFLVNFGHSLNLETKQDKAGNVLIVKPASPGYEQVKPIVLQSHIDMVCEKNNDNQHNFFTDPVKPYVEGEWVKALGTTLGADDGIGMAAQMAILADKTLKHGPIECLFTVDEETGLTGADALEAGFFNGDTLLNLDSEDEGELFIGCAGGIDTIASFQLKTEKAPENWVTIKIAVSGLTGGHSGDDIHRGLGNANKILTRFLHLAAKEHQFRLSVIDGGNLRNAIAREAYAIGVVPSSQKEPVRISFNLFSHDISEELKRTEPALKLTLGTCDKVFSVLTPDLQNKLIAAMYSCPHGVIEMSREMSGMVETSTNLASVKIKDNIIEVTTSQRSSVETARDYVAQMVQSLFELAGAHVVHSDGYPGWTPSLSSPILSLTTKAYVDLFENQPVVRAIHAGLECGLFLKKYPHLDMISFGPTIKGAHSPDERLHIPSVIRFWDLLIEVIKRFANE
jgi:dipeptidase D